MMRLYGAIEKVEPQDDGSVKVHGIATTEAIDDQGEIVKADAMRAAIPDYMKFPAIREMHQLSAAGTALEIEVGDDNVTRLVAHIVDPVAVTKVKNQVYRGFSIGGRVTKRDAGNSKCITGLALNEISLVDRPANPEAVFDCWKAASTDAVRGERPEDPGGEIPEPFNALNRAALPAFPAEAPLAQGQLGLSASVPESSPQVRLRPIQVWVCGDPEHRHIAKADALKCIEKRPAAGTGQTQAAVAAAEAELEQDGVEPGSRRSGTPGFDPGADPTSGSRHGEASRSEPVAVVTPPASSHPRRPVPEGLRDDGVSGPHFLHAGDPEADAGSARLARAGGDSGEPYGDVKFADPGYQADGKERYPIDTEAHIRAAWNYVNKPKNAGKYAGEHLAAIKRRIVTAWKDKIDRAGPPSAKDGVLTKHLMDVGPVAQVILGLDWLRDQLQIEAEMEGDDSPQPARLQAIIAELCGFLRALVAEEAAEVTGGDEIENRAVPIAMAAKPAAGDRAMEKRSEGDQHLMDVAHAAIQKALSMDGMTAKERGHMVQAREAMKAAVGLQPGRAEPEATPRDQTRDGSTSGDSTRGAGENGPADQHSTTDTGHNPEHPAPTIGGPDTTGRASHAVLDLIETALGKRSTGHQQLMKVAHHCVATLTDDATCESPPQARPAAERAGDGAGKAMGLQPQDLTRGSRHSQETMDHLHMAHFHLCAAGAKCDAAERGLPDEHQGTKFSAATAELQKALVCQSEALSEALGMLDQLSRRVEDIAKQPLPPVTIAKGTVAVDKIADGIGTTASVDRDIAKAWAAMSSEERTMALIKASYRNPYQPTSLANAAEIRSGETR